VRVVPGEADDYCVALGRDKANTFLVSADGDFLVEVGELGSFIPLQTFPATLVGTLHLSVYSQLRQKLGLHRVNDMVELAALLSSDKGFSVPQCIQYVNRQETLHHISEETLNRFNLQYSPSIKTTTSSVQEYLDCAGISGRLTELFFYDGVPVHWLPLFPVTSPPRKSPWLISRPIRQAAYYHLRMRELLRYDTVIEMIRRGPRMVEDTVPIEDMEIDISGKDQEEVTDEVFSCAMEILLQSVSDEEKKILPKFAVMYSQLRQPGKSFSSGVLSPTAQYVSSQYQSIVYSLMIYLQARDPKSTTPEFSSLWDLSVFKSTTATKLAAQWTTLTSHLEPVTQPPQHHPSPPPPKPPPRQHSPQDKNNRFSILATTPLQEEA